MKTIIYIDGFNLYFGCLHNTNYKWLDIVSLFSELCGSKNIHINYYTSPVQSKFSRHGVSAHNAQQDYLRALQVKYPDNLLIDQSYMLPKTVKEVMAGDVFDIDEKVKIWRIEEKQTDVKIALQMFEDAISEKNTGIRQILVSNDSDLEPALEKIKKWNSKIEIGIITPRTGTKGNKRPPNSKLRTLADWTRDYIKPDLLIKHQLPDKIPTGKKPIRKPKHW